MPAHYAVTALLLINHAAASLLRFVLTRDIGHLLLQYKCSTVLEIT